jgi:predicted O-methyltransferase YrrM
MAGKFALSSRLLTEPFWDNVLASGEDFGPAREQLAHRLSELDALRAMAAYNTGSISFTAAWCLYALVRRFGFQRAIEVGTFIGKSTVAMASAMDDGRMPGEIVTCDASNHIDLPWAGQTRLQQFKGQTSTQMLGALEGAYDFVFLDGRLDPADMAHVDRLTTPDTIFGLDDFEGVEKGVANLSALLQAPKFKRHLIVYPPPREVLLRHGLTGHSLTAVVLPASTFVFTRQG